MIDPIVDLTTNVDAFGKNIAPAESPYGIDAVNSQRYWNNTSPLYKTVASAISTATGSDGKFMPGAVEVSPNQIEYMVNWLGGGLAAFVTRSTDLVNPWGGNSALFGGKDFAVNDVPFLRTFYGNVSERNNTEFYFQNRDEVLRVRKALSDARKRGDSEEYQRLMQAYPNEYKS